MRNEGISPEPIPETHALGRMLRRTTESAFEAGGDADGEGIDYVWGRLLRLFPETLERRRLSPAFYVMQGKAAYGQVAEMDAVRPTARFFRKLTHEFEQCVGALHVERQFLYDSVYQYIGRQFPV